MNWLQSIKHRHSLRVFQSRSKKVKFPHQFVDFDKAKTLGFILNTAEISAEELVYFTKYITQLEDKGKNILVVEVNLKRKSEPLFTKSIKSIFINPSQLNWLSFPSIPRLTEINKVKCDIMFNLDTSEWMTSRFVCGLSNARMRVGIHEEEHESYYELMLQIDPEWKLNQIIKTYEKYSKMLEK